ncbi:Na+/H+ antiporter NhaA [Bacteroidetes/Chlorobi group bacterium ChocPot_Mid]|nr:MAG: Na+/H+ antiporter NhaA [Bacteroidetes/Chlorobi group bacterium ChocPot_Mid]
MKITTLFKEFFESEKAGGFLLLFCTIISLFFANLTLGQNYIDFWQNQFLGLSLELWVNDALMAVFFLLVGLEIEREIFAGELSNPKNIWLPVFAAIGGMATPALFHAIFNFGTETMPGIGIPTATDIAFSLGILSLLGKRVPVSLKIFLTALAIIDDLGAILIIAIFYSSGISLIYLIGSLSIFIIMLLMRKTGINNLWMYLIPGIGMWFLMLHSGIHPTISGVLLAFAIPFGHGEKKSPSARLQHFLHKPVAFIILPIFALANTAILINPEWTTGLMNNNSLGIIFGLVLGKPIGIFLFSLLALALGMGKLPKGINKKQILGVGFLAGIGFTMSIFISILAFPENKNIVVDSKIAILISSLVAGTIGYLLLYLTNRNMNTN